MARTLAAALAIGLAAGCSGDAIGPLAERADDDFEAMVLETVGIAEDQANGSSVVPLSAQSDVSRSSASDHGTCTYDSSTGRFICPDVVRSGVTISRSYALFNAADQPQDKRDSNTVKMNTQVWARGTVEKDDGKVTIDRRSDLTATGLQPSSPTRTLNGTEEGTSAMEHGTSRGTVLSNVVFGDTTINLVVPKPGQSRKWPLSGTVIRSHRGTRTLEGHSEVRSFSYRAVFVYDGSAVVKITITSNGQTKSCTLNMETRERHCTP
ncbi:MAG: hypothetical protein NUW01_07305 [Gemmatimonadaceae bacterium]|nr:hypothetical protein [Gemmatimonadaceae bacterium]